MQLPTRGAARLPDAEFLAAVQPQAVVLQNDSANQRGNPDASTLARFRFIAPAWAELSTAGQTVYAQGYTGRESKFLTWRDWNSILDTELPETF